MRAALPALQAPDERGIDPQPFGELLLSDPGPLAEPSECVSEDELVLIERGVRNPTWTKLCGLTEALGVTVSQLTREAEDEREVALAMREARARLKPGPDSSDRR